MSAINAKEKTCKQCNIVKSTEKFYKQKQRGKNNEVWEYYDSLCKECRVSYGSNRRREIKLKSVLYKGGKCVDCGYDNIKHLEVFDFHHNNKNEKDFSISDNAKSFESIVKELDKCVLLCANCHRIRHSLL